jgi:Na+/proline symporter
VGIALSGFLHGYSALGRDITAIAIVTILTLLYTFKGGMSTVIWTDVVQLTVYLTGTVIGVVTIVHLIPGGWHAAYTMAADAGKFHMFEFGWNFYAKYTFWSGLIGGAFLTTASHGTDQLIVMRLLASRNERSAKLALLASGVLVLFQFSLFLLARCSSSCTSCFRWPRALRALMPSIPLLSSRACRTESAACWSRPSSPQPCPI